MSDSDISDDLVATLRRWVAEEGGAGRVAVRARRRVPRPLVEQMKALGLFGTTIPGARRLGLDLLTYARLIEELAYGWMSLSGIVNTHTIAAT